jgi:prepilin-type processing-associated H-X9-DG protein
VFATAREKARQSACLSNLKQVGLAYTQYEQDYDETVPCGQNGYGFGSGWAGQVYPYVKSTKTFLCPDDSLAGDVISYAANANMVGYSAASPPTPLPALISSMASPAKTVMLFEVNGCNTTGTSPAWTIPTDQRNSPVGNGSDNVSANSLQGANVKSGSTPCPTCLKYRTGLLANVCVASVSSPCDRTGATLTGNNSYYGAIEGIHGGGAVYLMADCHAKWMMPNQVAAGTDLIQAGVDYPALCPGALNSRAPKVDCATPVMYAATFALH